MYNQLHHRDRVLSDRIPQVLVNLCFYRGLSGKEGIKWRISGLKRYFIAKPTQEDSRRHERRATRRGGTYHWVGSAELGQGSTEPWWLGTTCQAPVSTALHRL